MHTPRYSAQYAAHATDNTHCEKLEVRQSGTRVSCLLNGKACRFAHTISIFIILLFLQAGIIESTNVNWVYNATPMYHISYIGVKQWKPLIMITLGPALFDNNNRLITLSGGYKNLHYLTQFIVTTFYMYKKQKVEFSLSSLV